MRICTNWKCLALEQYQANRSLLGNEVREIPQNLDRNSWLDIVQYQLLAYRQTHKRSAGHLLGKLAS